jgi:membrane protein required for colicin V production
MSLDWFDVVLAIVIVLSVAAGLKSGFARVVVNLLATVVGLLAGFWFYQLAALEIVHYLNFSLAAAKILGFIIIFVGVILLGSLLASLFARLFRWIGLSWFDHFLGGVAGFVRGILVIAAVTDVVIAFAAPPLPVFIQNSKVLPYASEVVSSLAQLAPRELKESVDDHLDALRHFWRAPEAPRPTEI